MRLALRLIWAGLMMAVPLGASIAQEPFYKGKQIRIVISAGVAGGYNEYARLLAAHMGNHIAGKPDFIVQIKQPFKIKAEGFMPYQMATVETTLTEDKWVQAYEIMPTAREVVHHVIVNVHPKGARIGRGGDEGGGGYWAAYVPGNSSRIYPDGFARKLPAGATISGVRIGAVGSVGAFNGEGMVTALPFTFSVVSCTA